MKLSELEKLAKDLRTQNGDLEIQVRNNAGDFDHCTTVLVNTGNDKKKTKQVVLDT